MRACSDSIVCYDCWCQVSARASRHVCICVHARSCVCERKKEGGRETDLSGWSLNGWGIKRKPHLTKSILFNNYISKAHYMLQILF